jgi:hypothetical protein
MRRVILTTLGLLALAGCQRSEEKAASAEGAASPAAQPSELGMRKAGLWTQTVSVAGLASTSMKMCLDAADLKDAQLTGPEMSRDRCSKNAVTPAPGGWTFESVCDAGDGGTMTLKGTAKGNGDGYTMELTSTTTGAARPEANVTTKTTVVAKWEGPCPAGMSPGDMQVGGMTINAGSMKALQEQVGKAAGN